MSNCGIAVSKSPIQKIDDKETQLELVEEQANEEEEMLSNFNDNQIHVKEGTVIHSEMVEKLSECNYIVEEYVGRDKKINDIDWLPVEQVQWSKFFCTVTYVTDDIQVCVTLNRKQRRIRELEKNIHQHYKDKVIPDYSDWKIGQICMAKYSDNCPDSWCRAKILKLDLPKLFVEYVDYGVVSWLTPNKVRRDVIYTDIPIQCHKFRVHRCYAQYPRDLPVPKFLYEKIVDKKCLIKLAKDKRTIRKCTVKIRNDECITLYHILEQLKECYTIETSYNWFWGKILEAPEAVELSDTSSSGSSVAEVEDLSFAPQINDIDEEYLASFTLSSIEQETDDPALQVCEMRIPDAEWVKILVTDILTESLIAVNIIDCDFDPTVKQIRRDFAELEEELQKDAIEQPLIKSPFEGQLCCTKFNDGKWYRTIIIRENDDKYTVYYIDYGNAQDVMLSELHQLKPHWYRVPAQAIKCHFRGEYLHFDEPPSFYEVTHRLFERKFDATIRVRENYENEYLSKYLIRIY